MQDLSGAPGSESEIAAFRARSGALRQSAALPGAPLPQLLEAAFAELDGAIDAAARLRAEAVPAGDQSAQTTGAHLERTPRGPDPGPAASPIALPRP